MSYKYETKWDSPNFTKGRASIDFIVIHWWDDPAKNPSYEGVISTLANPARQASAHYVATGTGRRVACLVAPGDTAWHAGDWNANTKSIGIECDPRCRPEDYDVVAELVADIRSAYGNKPLKKHSDFSATRCPGTWDLAKINKIALTKVSHAKWGDVTTKPITPPKPPVAPPTPPPVVIPPVVTPPVVEPPVKPEPQPEVPETAPEQPDAPEVVQNVWVLLFDFLLTIIKKLFRK